MFHTIATKHSKKIAAFLFCVLYLNLALPVAAHALWPPTYPERTGEGMYTYRPAFQFHPAQPAEKQLEAIAGVPEKIERPSIAEKLSIGGPGQPEMAGFKSVNSNDMVDLFTGDFSYNIPLMDVGGYPVNIHYNSNVSMDQEASWVGFGWNINPGTVGRSVRGLPDDFDGSDSITKVQSIKPNKTIGVTVAADAEIIGTPVGIGTSMGIFHNTYNGWGVEKGINASISVGSASYGTLSSGLSLTNNSQTGTTVSPSIGYQFSANDDKNIRGTVSMGLSTGFNSRTGMSSLQLNTSYRLQHVYEDITKNSGGAGTSVPLAAISFATPSYTPSINMPYTSTNYSFHARVGGLEFYGLDAAINLSGYVSKQEIRDEDKVQSRPAVGYLYYARSNDNTNTLLDFNREKEAAFTNTTPNIAIPQYTYDLYSISGEGTGGMFRPYRGDIGYIRDNYVRSKSGSDRFSIDLGFGNVFHGGADFTYSNSYSENNPWIADNNLQPYLKFRTNDTTYQAVYMRNPGERTTNAQAYYSAIGGEALIRARLDGSGDHVSLGNSFLTFKNGTQTADLPVTSNIGKKERDKRSQVISYLTAEEANIYGLDKKIYSYPENTIPGLDCHDSVTVLPRYNDGIRKKNHLSQITVLNGDGRRYVYGIPAYNVEQRDVTFSVDAETDSDNISKGLASYGSTDNTPANSKGKDGYFSEDITPAYAHSFLLTGIVSADYVDLKNDGITEDDMGDAVKFNYTRVYGDSNNYFKWRTPYNLNKGNSNEGLKTYNRDDKATYMYGKKEVWYLNSIESKTMVAVFKIAKDRKDIYSVQGENGGLDTSRRLARLQQIDLYVKADLVKHGLQARPIKTVHFSYSYSLCKGIAGDTSKGKLTLDSLWFSYNGNEKGKLNPYVFRYHPGVSASNPAYNPKSYDRWGNYQNPATNPGALPNSDYPYTQQDSTLASTYASVWTLNEVRLPSGALIKVGYEADDYAYVQNKRATRFFRILGVGNTSSGLPDKKLYTSGTFGIPVDNDYVYVHSDVPLTGKADVMKKFLEGNQFVYFKLSVVMPSDVWGSGKEFVPVYAQVEDYGVTGTNRFWLKLAHVEGQSPLARAALQFLRLNLPSKAYPNSEPGDDIGVWDAVKMMAVSMGDMLKGVQNYNTQARRSGFCKEIDTTKSFIRLDCPNYKKYGGGLRVKRIEIYDNWKNMTGQRESVYGQQYDYTTVKNIDGVNVRMSSGVASYEPTIGAEENPFHQPIPYAEKTAPMAPVNYMFTEMPLGESYFPSASVGYSKVRVRTINTKAKSVNGWAETEYFTTKDFPTIVESTILDETAKKSYNPKLSSFLRINAKNYITLSQGFRVELNDMNGKVKAQASYSEKDSLHPVSYTKNFYKVDNDSSFQPHLNNTVWAVDSVNGHLNSQATIGEDIEVMQDFREEFSRTISGDYGLNIDYFQVGFFPVILPSNIPLPQKEVVRFRSAATVKIVQRYGILDSVSAMDKGSVVSTKNLVYDGETGEVVLSRTNNEFNDPVFNFSYPAHWAYSGMGMAYKNMDAEFRNLKLISGRLYYGGTSTIPYPVERFFESGDEVQLTGVLKSAQSGANCMQYQLSDPPQPVISRPIPMKAWVVDARKGIEGDKGLYFVDEEGNPVTVQANYIRILRSGRRNMLDASVGSIMSMASPIKQVSAGRYRLVFDSSTRIINTSAVTYKDSWKSENFIYPKDTAIKVYHNYSVVLHPTDITVKRLYSYRNEEGVIEHSKIMATAFDFMGKNSCVSAKAIHTRSYLRFSFDTLPVDAVFLSASMNLTGRAATDLWLDIKKDDKGSCSVQKSYDWVHNATTSHAGTSLSYLRRMTVSWNANTPFNSMVSSTTHQVAVNYNSLTNLNCTDLIQDLLTNGNQGISFEVNRTTVEDNHNTEIDYLSTCGIGSPACTPPELTVNYKLLEDSLAPRCRTLNNDSAVNPYKFGLLGNWRVDRSYTFYHDRKESDASSSATRIRKEGEIKSFSPFWTFTDSVLTQAPDTAKWVWNSASSMYSKKGFEIENYDPLGRYNAGLYGYNGSLPIAVAQNSRFRELLYDGFEDYGYKSKECTLCGTTRAIDFVQNNTGVSLNDSISHTGMYSIKLDASSEAKFTAPIITMADDTLKQYLSFVIDSGIVYDTLFKATGQGLDQFYDGYSADSVCMAMPGPPTNFHGSYMAPVDFNWQNSIYSGAHPLSGSICHDWFTIKWLGKLRPTRTDNYTFYALSDRAIQVYINGVHIIDALTPNQQTKGATLKLYAGHLYDVKIKYLHTVGSLAQAKLSWSKESLPGVIEVVPTGNLYTQVITEKDTIGWMQVNVANWCVAAANTKPRHFINPSFSPLENSKLVVSAWVKMDGNDCNSAPALDDVLHAIVYKDADVQESVTLSRTGVRIEGWQRYEGVITVPVTSTSIKINAVAPSDRAIYVDDIRVQPYNSAVKGYVYDPVTLRLMAELDENNYASFYEYDDDGTLIRVKKETERGVMTVKETRSALLKDN
jgi:hypothetical protein